MRKEGTVGSPNCFQVQCRLYIRICLAVQNERDRIRNVKRKNSNNLLQAPNDHLNLIMEAENVANQLRATVITNTNGNSPSVPNTVLPNCITRLASIHDLSEAIKQQLVLLVEWAKALPPFCELDLQDQVDLSHYRL